MLLSWNKMSIKLILSLILLISGNSNLFTQNKVGYPEIELYNKTLSEESTEAYNKALSTYQKESKTEKIHSSDKKLNDKYKQIISLPEDNEDHIQIKIKQLEELSLKAAKKGEYNLEFTALTDAFRLAFWGKIPFYNIAFIIALKLEHKLDKVTEEQYPDKRATYFKIGEAYYLFKDYDKSITMLRHAITYSLPSSFTDQANLNARKIIGICYANKSMMDSSDYYFKSTLKSQDIVLDRPIYNAYALSHLGCNAMLKGEYDKALAFDTIVLPLFKKGTDYGHIAGMYTCQTTSYLRLGNYAKAITLADSILSYANRDTYNRNKRRKQAFTMLALCNSLKGNALLTQTYNDSLINIYKQEEADFNSEYISNARQIVLNEQILLTKEEAHANRMKWIISVSISFLLLAALVYIMRLYQKNKVVYRALVDKSHKWAQMSPYNNLPLAHKEEKKITDEDIRIMELVNKFIFEQKNYLNADLTLDLLADCLNINRKYISSAINKITGKNFNTYLNEYRIREAINMLSSTRYDSYSIDAISGEAGFNSRRPFYEYFKKITNLTPAEFRKNRKRGT